MEQTILQKYLEGNATNEEIELVVTWLDSSEDNVQQLIKLRKLHNISIFNEPIKENKRKTTIRTRKIMYEVAKVAAIFLLFGVGNYFLTNKKEEASTQRFYVPPGQRAELMLPDSSIVWLNAQTTLNYSSDFGKSNRNIELNGEAYFKVKKNPNLTFVVKTKDIDINVLGTEFNVISYQDEPHTEVSLLSGSIRITGSQIPDEGITMKTNNYFRIVQGKYETFGIQDYDYFRWKDGILSFSNEPIGSIMKKLELYYDTHIEVKNESLLKLPYTGKFRSKDGVEQVLKVLQHELKFTYTVNTELNLITIK
ncbi:FecR family protein [Bacteroides sp. 519]|nr:FecR family protein [Bacteroides sp. 519]